MRKMLSRNQTIELVNEAIESGEIHADPSTEVKVSDINSEDQVAGKVIVSDGEGGAEWGDVGGGTEVIANPEGTPTSSLSSLQVGDEIFSVGGGSGEMHCYSVRVALPNFTSSYSKFFFHGYYFTTTDNLAWDNFNELLRDAYSQGYKDTDGSKKVFGNGSVIVTSDSSEKVFTAFGVSSSGGTSLNIYYRRADASSGSSSTGITSIPSSFSNAQVYIFKIY